MKSSISLILSSFSSTTFPFILKFFCGLTPLLSMFVFKFFFFAKNRLWTENTVDHNLIFNARKRYQNRQLLPRATEKTGPERGFDLIVRKRKRFSHQVAGHTEEVLVHHKDMVLKPLNKLKLFIQEVNFYEKGAEEGRYSYNFPHSFLAPYYGVVVGVNEDGKKTPYIALGNVSRNLVRPCMIDIKMGRQTFEPTAPLDKMLREKIKYKYQERIGFRVCGFKVFDSLSESYFSVGKRYGRSLTPDIVSHGLAAFFHNGLGHFRVNVMKNLVRKLELLLQWVMKQNKWHFYCTSLLITYDAEAIQSRPSCESLEMKKHILQLCVDTVDDTSAKTENVLIGESFQSSEYLLRPKAKCFSTLNRYQADIVDVRMIDHAHTLESNGKRDEGYIFALKSLIFHIEQIISMCHEGYCEPSLQIATALKSRSVERSS